MRQPAQRLQLALLLAVRQPFDEPHLRADQTTIQFREIRQDPKRHRLGSTRTTVERRGAGWDWYAVQRPRLSGPERHLDVLARRGQSAAVVQGADPAHPEGDGVVHDLEWRDLHSPSGGRILLEGVRRDRDREIPAAEHREHTDHWFADDERPGGARAARVFFGAVCVQHGTRRRKAAHREPSGRPRFAPRPTVPSTRQTSVSSHTSRGNEGDRLDDPGGRRRFGRCRHGSSLAGQIPAGERQETAPRRLRPRAMGVPTRRVAAPDGRRGIGWLNDPPQRDQIDQERPAGRIAQRADELLGIEGLVVEKSRNDFVCTAHGSFLSNVFPERLIAMVRDVAIGAASRSRSCSRVRWMRERTASAVNSHAAAISS